MAKNERTGRAALNLQSKGKGNGLRFLMTSQNDHQHTLKFVLVFVKRTDEENQTTSQLCVVQ